MDAPRHEPLLAILLAPDLPDSKLATRSSSSILRDPTFFADAIDGANLVASPSSGLPPDIATLAALDPAFESYLDRLTDLSLSSLQAEPDLLQQESANIEAQLAQLAFSEYASFIQAHSCTGSIMETFESMETSLDRLEQSLPAVEAAATLFADASAKLLDDKQQLSFILSQHAKIEDLLEIPQLMDTFIKSGYYEEAMELSSFVHRLVLRYPGIRLLKQISTQVLALTKTMLAQLVQLLRGNVKLPLCIRVIGYLRSLKAFSESELRLVFLQQRDHYLKKQLAQLKPEDGARWTSAEYLKRYVDTSRESFFDIITQYKAIFSDSSSSISASQALSPTSTSASASAALDLALEPPRAASSVFDTEGTNSTASVLASYVTATVGDFLDTLESHLPNVTDASVLGSLLTQTMYYGMSLGRVGIDFRELLVAPFEAAIHSNVRRTIQGGLQTFVDHINAHGVLQLKTGVALSYDERRSSSTAGPDAVPQGGLVTGYSASGTTARYGLDAPEFGRSSNHQIYSPPQALMAYPTLAALLNTYFTAFNQLRVTAAISLIPALSSTIESTLVKLTESIQRKAKETLSKWSTDDKAKFADLCDVLCQVFVPCVVDAFENGVYGSVLMPGTGLIAPTRDTAAATEGPAPETSDPAAAPERSSVSSKSGTGIKQRTSVRGPFVHIESVYEPLAQLRNGAQEDTGVAH